MMILGLTSASFSCTHFHEVELFQAFLSAVHSLVWLIGPSPQYSRLMPQPECLRRSYMVVPPVLGMCTKYSRPHSMSTAHLHTDCAVLGQPFAHVVVHQSSVAMALMAAYPCLQTSAPSAVGATEASATLVGTGDGDANGGDANGAGDGVGGGGGGGDGAGDGGAAGGKGGATEEQTDLTASSPPTAARPNCVLDVAHVLWQKRWRVKVGESSWPMPGLATPQSVVLHHLERHP